MNFKKLIKLIGPFIVSIILTVVIVYTFYIYFCIQYAVNMEHSLKIKLNKNDGIFSICVESKCYEIYDGKRIYAFDKLKKEKINDANPNYISQGPILFTYKDILFKNNLSVLIPLYVNETYNTIYFITDISKFIPSFVLLYFLLIIFFNIPLSIIFHLLIKYKKELNYVELSKNKSFLQFDNLMFYIENLNHEVKSPLFVLARKLKELSNRTEKNEKNEKNFEIMFNSIEQIDAVMQRTSEVKHINTESEDKTIFDVIESTIATIKILRSDNINSDTNIILKQYYLDQDYMNNGMFLNILTNQIKNSIEAYADLITTDFVNIKNNKLTFTITDNGNGIAKEHRSLIFKKGFTTKNTNDKNRGSGLSINKFILESANGSIKLNNIKKGAQFEISVMVKTIDMETTST